MADTTKPADADRIAYRPPWVGEYVTGSYTKLTRDADGIPEEQTFEASCAECGAKLGPRKCSSGMVRHWIDQFSRVHLHRHALAPLPTILKP
jgi:hypothetical protein